MKLCDDEDETPGLWKGTYLRKPFLLHSRCSGRAVDIRPRREVSLGHRELLDGGAQKETKPNANAAVALASSLLSAASQPTSVGTV